MHRRPLIFARSSRVAAVTACVALALLTPGSLAQEATPVGAAEDAEMHPAHIHSGTCAELGDVVVPLTDLTDPGAGTERTGPASALPVEVSETIVDMPLEEIIDGGHAVNVHLSAEEIGTYIACGDIGGALITDEGGRTELIIGLSELNDSGHHGVAWLGAEGEQTEVVVVLTERSDTE